MLRKLLFVCIGCILPFPVFASGAVINEVLFDPAGTDTGLEWVEIFNGGTEPADLSGWELYPDGIGYFTFPQGFSLPPQGFVTVYLRASGTASARAQYHSSATGNMGNTSGSVALFSGEPRGKDTVKSFVEWEKSGETWESASSEAGLWVKEGAIGLASWAEGSSIALLTDGDTAGGAGAWIVAAVPSPGDFNLPPSASSSPAAEDIGSSTPEINSSSPRSPAPSYFFPELHAYAGEDRTAAAGSLIEFSGQSAGDKKEPLENAHYWWNFGDGDTAEGRVVSHIFAFPGVYAVGLHVTSGIYAVSDYLSVKVVPNQLVISDVTGGENGFFRVRNNGKEEVDIGGWIARDADEKQFIIPWRTKVMAGSEVSLSNRLTGLLLGSHGGALFLSYLNGARALEWKKEAARIALNDPAPASPVFSTSSLRPDPEKNSSSGPVSPEESKTGTSTDLSVAQAGVGGAFSLRPSFFFIGALLVSFLGAASFLFFKRPLL